MLDEVLGKNQAMRMILGQAKEDDYAQICSDLARLSIQIRAAGFPEEKLKGIKSELNVMLYSIQKELMCAPADSRVSHLSPKCTEERTSDSAD